MSSSRSWPRRAAGATVAPGPVRALVWMKAARAVGARPDWRRVTVVGLAIAPLSLLAAAGALRVFTPTGW